MCILSIKKIFICLYMQILLPQAVTLMILHEHIDKSTEYHRLTS